MIRCEHIYKSFDGKPVLEDISATFLPGEINMIIGRSGSGKTVLIKSIAGLFPVDEGEIYYGDTLFTSLDFRQKKAIRRDVGMIFQGGALLDSSTVEENIRFPLDMFTGQSMAEKRERVAFCLHRVNLEGAEKLYPAELSGGMIKRVAIARAIVMNPRYLFCDEPNSGLDPVNSNVIDQPGPQRFRIRIEHGQKGEGGGPAAGLRHPERFRKLNCAYVCMRIDLQAKDSYLCITAGEQALRIIQNHKTIKDYVTN